MSRPASARIFADLSRALTGYRWYVFGAQAAVTYGRPRLTADVDVTVESLAGPEGPERLVKAMAGAGFALRLPGLRGVLEQARVLPLVHAQSGVPVDVVLAGPGLEEEFLSRARLTDVGGVQVPMISPEDLVATKLLAARPKDLEDVAGVLGEQLGRLDLAHVRSPPGLRAPAPPGPRRPPSAPDTARAGPQAALTTMRASQSIS
jgi:hypothetical protein